MIRKDTTDKFLASAGTDFTDRPNTPLARPQDYSPFEVQLPNESKKFWSSVTEAIISKQYNQATTLKQELEQRQRDKAEERKSRNAEWKPRFFNEVTSKDGRPTLTEDGKRALEGLLKDQYELKPSAETGA